MRSQTVKPIITIHIMPNIPRNKDNQTMKYGQLIECNVRNSFLKNHAENEARRLVPHLFLFFKKALYKAKESGLHPKQPPEVFCKKKCS